MLGTYTCHKCRAEFPSRESAHKHYNENWHQYNLARAMKDLPPITQEAYTDLMTKSAFLEEAKNKVAAISCKACKKNFTSQGSFDTHQKSRKHKQNLVRKTAEFVEGPPPLIIPENLRRVNKNLSIKKQLESQKNKAGAVLAVEQASTAEEGDAVVPKGSMYCTACKASFASEKDFTNHSETLKHNNAVKAVQLTEKRQRELDNQDKIHATDKEQMEVDDEAAWEDVDGDDDAEDSDGGEDAMEADLDDEKPIPANVCLFCSKRSANIADNIGHMERQHSFFVPHQKAADLDKLQTYIGEKVGVGHQCLECSKEFQTLRACRLHMLDKPHLSIRFEGEYDQFFKIEKIMAAIQLPARPAENDMFAFPMPDGTSLTHRDLRRYANQRLHLRPTIFELKRLAGGFKAVTHLGKNDTSRAKSVMEVRKENTKVARNVTRMQKTDKKQYLDVAVKANKLQKHFRHQVINAG